MKISPACKAAAKRKYKVWPSAYASGYGVKCTKAGGPKMKSKTKGGGTTKACLPAAKVASMSKKEKDAVIRAKRTAGKSGKRERSSKSNVTGARKKGATLRDWFEKENWVNVSTGKECGK
jgi:hypothetical protein|tara:strand:- start:45 stop:404 length:360 start_codon:yes stop_codon:yes gene_type:complete